MKSEALEKTMEMVNDNYSYTIAKVLEHAEGDGYLRSRSNVKDILNETDYLLQKGRNTIIHNPRPNLF